MKTYIKPVMEQLELKGDCLLAELSAIDPNNSGEDIYGGDGNSTEHPLDAKENKGFYYGWDETEDEDW